MFQFKSANFPVFAYRNSDVGDIVLAFFLTIEKKKCFVPAASQREFAKLFLAGYKYPKHAKET